MNSLEKNDALASLEEVTKFIQSHKSKAATGHISFTFGGTKYRWEHVLAVVAGRTVLTATHDDSGEPMNGTLLITFPNTLTAGQPINFGLGEAQAAAVFVFGDYPSFPGLGPVFTLTKSTPGSHYEGTFSCANLFLTEGTFSISA
ncbi:hypothetical protein OH720_25880 [Pseudomonas sp. WJP1]|uniref:hypothetical protein n=1 Tax=Pseudomonas sp. WJP1 TaxID=2986947 RepID=UPI00234B26C4|nr:hypothetical protein [Pseudomonas sp. WJP1]WCM50353.1 hypothetical protein OH720_25880 [Pseudomonas sp. WJP1]